MSRQIYCTTFCNFGHYVDTGRPIGHECRIIPPRLLRKEMSGAGCCWDAHDYAELHRQPIVVGRALAEQLVSR